MSKKVDIEQLMTTDISLSDLARLTEVRRQSISDRLDEIEMPFKVGPANSKMYNVAAILSHFLSVGQNGVEDETTDEKKDRAKLLRATREIAEQKSQKMKGELVSLSEISGIISSEYSQVRSQFINLGESLCRELALESDPEIVSEMITTKVNAILSALRADNTVSDENKS